MNDQAFPKDKYSKKIASISQFQRAQFHTINLYFQTIFEKRFEFSVESNELLHMS